MKSSGAIEVEDAFHVLVRPVQEKNLVSIEIASITVFEGLHLTVALRKSTKARVWDLVE